MVVALKEIFRWLHEGMWMRLRSQILKECGLVNLLHGIAYELDLPEEMTDRKTP